MEKKELKKISRKELLELMLKQAERIKDLETELDKVNRELENKKLKIKESGSIAEASLKLNDMFESAQKSIDEYILNVEENMRKKEEAILKEAQKEKRRIVSEAKAKMKLKEEKFNEDLKKLKEETKTTKVSVKVAPKSKTKKNKKE